MNIFRKPEDPLTADVPIHIVGENGKLVEVGSIRSSAHEKEDAKRAASARKTILIEGHLAITTFDDDDVPQSR